MNNSVVEAVLDQGSVVAGEAECPICEFEMELKAGSAADLLTAAKALANYGTAPCRTQQSRTRLLAGTGRPGTGITGAVYGLGAADSPDGCGRPPDQTVAEP